MGFDWIVTDKNGDEFELSIAVDRDKLADYIIGGRRRNQAFANAKKNGKYKSTLSKGGVKFEIRYRDPKKKAE